MFRKSYIYITLSRHECLAIHNHDLVSSLLRAGHGLTTFEPYSARHSQHICHALLPPSISTRFPLAHTWKSRETFAEPPRTVSADAPMTLQKMCIRLGSQVLPIFLPKEYDSLCDTSATRTSSQRHPCDCPRLSFKVQQDDIDAGEVVILTMTSATSPLATFSEEVSATQELSRDSGIAVGE